MYARRERQRDYAHASQFKMSLIEQPLQQLLTEDGGILVSAQNINLGHLPEKRTPAFSLFHSVSMRSIVDVVVR